MVLAIQLLDVTLRERWVDLLTLRVSLNFPAYSYIHVGMEFTKLLHQYIIIIINTKYVLYITELLYNILF